MISDFHRISFCFSNGPYIVCLSSYFRSTSTPKRRFLMGSLLGDWPSFDPHNFSQLRPSDPSNPSKLTPATYHPTHNRTVPPPNQVISTEATNILLRQFYQRAEEKLRPKRAASENLTPDHGFKQPRGSFPDETSN